MIASELLAHLRDHGVELVLDAERLCYHAPAGVLSEEIRAQLRAHRDEICALLRRRPSPEPLRRVPERRTPLSFAQRLLWYIVRSHPESPAYNMATVLYARGLLQVTALRRSLDEIALRHEILGSAVEVFEGQPFQVRSRYADVSLPVVDLRSLGAGVSDAEVRRQVEQEALRPFTLERGPLWRAVLLHRGESEHVLLLTVHHLATDEWSMEILGDELSTLYDAFSSGRPSPLLPPALQYTDFARWQRASLSERRIEELAASWQRALAGSLPILKLPADRPRPASPSLKGGRCPIALPTELVTALSELGRRAQATLFMTLLAGFVTTLQRLSGQDELLVGTVVAGRDREELEGLIGCFLNTLALRFNLSLTDEFAGLLSHVRKVVLDAFGGRHLPFELLIQKLHPDRDGGHIPLFQVAFTLQNTPPKVNRLGGLELVAAEVDTETAKLDLTLLLRPSTEGLEGSLEYSRDLFDRSTALRLARTLCTVLQGVAAQPSRPLAALPLLTPEESHQILIEWNDSAAPPGLEPRLDELVALHSRQRPASIALAFEDRLLTFGELEIEVGRLASRLLRLGVGPERIVGVCLPRGLEMVVAMLAIFRAGATYLPLDPADPPARRSHIFETSRAMLLLTDPLSARLAGSAAAVLALEPGGDRRAEAGAGWPRHIDQRALAYVIYTSGSSGEPKGVAVEHGGLARLARTQTRALGVSAASRVLQFASPGFDASISEVAMALFPGATLCLARREHLAPGRPLRDTLLGLSISVVTLPPSLLSVMDLAGLPSLRTVILAGESCTQGALESASAPDRRIFNAYGPTEATVCAALFPADATPTKVPIGRPLEGTRITVLDRELRPVPVGVPGELCISGAALARGYLGRVDLTATRFVPDPFPPQGEAGARLYRSGDISRHLSDGSLEFLGRIDRQLKLRGQRIEPGEIEEVLARHPEVRETAVIATGENTGETRLIAYVVPEEAAAQAVRAQEPEIWPSVAEYLVYDELLYHAMTHDELRNRKYQVAIEQQAAGRVVIDVGTGRDAILARLCAAAGARKVYAVERMEESYRSAVSRVRSLGLADRITVIHGDIDEIELPEPADLCVSEIVGPIGGCEGAAVLLNAARRLLRPGGTMIPLRSVTKIAAARLPENLAHHPRFARSTPNYVATIFAQVGHPFDLRVCIKRFPSDHLVSTSDVFEELDFSAATPTRFERTIHLTFPTDTTFDGFLIWLTLYTTEGQVIDILEQEHCWLPVYLPVFHPGIDVAAGDRLVATCCGELSDDGVHPDYRVRGALYRTGGERTEIEVESPHHGSRFMANPFHRSLFALRVEPERQGEAEYRSIERSVRRIVDWLPAPREGAGRAASTGRLTSAIRRESSLRDYLQARLPAYMLPSYFVPINGLPRNASGKVDLRGLPRLDLEEARRGKTFTGPRDSWEQQLLGIWQQVLGLQTLGVTEDFFEAGGHSYLAVRLIAQIEACFGQELALTTLLRAGTIEKLARVLRERAAASPTSPLVQIAAGASRPPFFCVHAIGGNVLGYLELARRMSPDQPVFGLQAPGVDGHSRPRDTVEALAEHFLTALREVQPNGPYHLGGHSFGGIVAFEMAQQLRSHSEEVRLLALIDVPVPSQRESPALDDAERLVQHARVLERFFGRQLAMSYEEMRRLEPDEQVGTFLNRLKDAGVLPPDAGLQLVRGILAVQRASQRAAACYLPQAYEGDIALMRAASPVIDESMPGSVEDWSKPGLGWAEISSGRVSVHIVPGDHITMLVEPNVRVLAQALQQCLDEAHGK